MKTLGVLLLTIVLNNHVSGYLIKVPTVPTAPIPTVAVHTQWVHLQKLMIPLFENVCETSSNPVIQRLAKEFSFEPTEYSDPGVINSLQTQISGGLLPKGTIFTEYDPVHMNELRIVYDVLYSANNFDVFYKAAAWARQNLNCALYVNAIYMAIQHRRDTERLSIPAPYELLPNYFVNKDAIVKAAAIFTGEDITQSESIHYEGNAYTIDANYTALFYDNDDDSKLAYFREDVGLNSYYFLRKLRLAPWFNNDVNGGFGENMYQMMKQFMARYNLERYANDLPEIESINWSSMSDIPYDPMLIYSNGNDFGHRTSSVVLPENEDLLLLKTIENNIVAVVSHLRQSGYNKTQILNHLMEILVTSDRSYETLARKLLGKDLTNNGPSSVLEHYMTSLRDPMFWKINKKIVDMIDEALKILPKYERNELYFPGVEVVNIEVKKIMTACDYFQFDVTDALKIEESRTAFKIKIGQPRLNHKQFTMKVNVSSLVAQKGLVKIYLGPKLMPGEFSAKKNLFTLLDVFEINLKKGTNIITRSSDDMKQFSEDFMALDTIRQKVDDAEFGLDSLPLKTVESQIGYPSRLILPKGTPQGLPLQMFVFVAPYIKASVGISKNSMEFNTAVLSPGYPLDLMIEDKQLFELPNAMMKYISVTQKSDSKVENYGGPGITKSWYGTDTYDPSSRPNFNSNKGQYGQNFNYAEKKHEINTEPNEIVPDGENQDYYDIIGLNVVPKLQMTSRLDYSSQGTLKEPFDYKAKKGQFDNKNYSAKGDYTKYQTKPTVDADIIVPTPASKVYTTNDDNIHKNKEDSDELLQPYPLKIEPLPLPAMLKKGAEEPEKFDYKLKKKEKDFKIKAIRTALDELIKDAKLKQYTKDKLVYTTNQPSTSDSSDFAENKGTVILSDGLKKFDRQVIKNGLSEPVDFMNKEETNSFESSEEDKDKIKLDHKIKRTDFVENDITQKNIERDELTDTGKRSPSIFDYFIRTIAAQIL